MEENQDFDNINLEEAFGDNEESLTLDDVVMQRPQADPNAVSAQMTASKLSKLEEQLSKITDAMENGKKTTYLDKVLSKYENVDPVFKQMLIDMNIASNEFTKENLKVLQSHFVDIQKEITQLKEEQKALSDYTTTVHTDITMNRLVRKYLERGFKKNTIKEEHVEKAIEEHNKRLSKDEAYVLKMQNIWNAPNFSTAAKNRLTGELILQNFRDVATKAKGKAADAMPDMKKSVAKDDKVEKDKEKLEKSTPIISEEGPKVTQDELRAKLANKLRRL